MKIMKKLFSKKEKWINGTLIIKKEDIDKVAAEFLFVNEMIGNDEDEVRALCDTASLGINELTVCLPITTTEKIWKKLKASSKLNIVATSEHRAERPEPMGIILA